MTPEDLEEWLQDKPQQVAILMAARSALRVAPLTAREPNLVFPALRAMSISSVAGIWPTDDISSLRSAARSADSAALSAYSAARSAALSAALSAARSAALSAALSADSAALSAVETFDAETLKQVFHTPLWPENPDPEFHPSALPDTLHPVLRDFFSRAFHGQPQNWPLLRDLALLDRDIWYEGGPRFDEAVAELELKHVANTSAGRVVWDAEAQLARWQEEVSNTPKPFAEILDRLRFELERFAPNMALPQQSGALETMILSLRDALSMWSDAPSEIYNELEFALGDIAYQLKANEVADDARLDRLRRVFVQAQEDLYASHESIRSQVGGRKVVRVMRMDDDQKEAVTAMVAGVRPLAEPRLGIALDKRTKIVISGDLDPANEADQALVQVWSGQLAGTVLVVRKHAWDLVALPARYPNQTMAYTAVATLLTAIALGVGTP
ncbi:MAG: hypothetical protein AAGJ96_04025 [Pseudomonadota bacterium]